MLSTTGALTGKLSFAAMLTLTSFAALRTGSTSTGEPAVDDARRNVILVTWDGVRRLEFLGAPDPELADGDDAPTLPYFWSELADKGRVYGNPRDGASMIVANPAFMSLPAYQSIMAGTTQTCTHNDCGQTSARTFPERIIQDLGLESREVATVASWEKMAYAVERRIGATFVNAGNAALDDGTDDPELAAINAAQAADPAPWQQARLDRYTHQHAMRYLKTHRPRFLFVGMNDSDEWGHRGDYPAYLGAIRQYDAWLAELIETLRAMGDYGKRTCLLVTTDHGRGNGAAWPKHSNGVPESGVVWMYAGCPLDDAPPAFEPRAWLTTHLDIRPTIERLLGLVPRTCLTCGTSLTRGD